MKKNAMLKIAAVLLVAVLLTTCAISSTFAKYATNIGSHTATARVAKWGVDASTTLTATGALFAETYEDGDVVSAVDGQCVVAPGTEGSLTLDFVVKANSEVKSQIWLTDGSVGKTQNFLVSDFPEGTIEWSTDDFATTCDVDDINDAIADWAESTVIAANTPVDIEKTITIYWRWIFENDVVGKDTLDTNTGKGSYTCSFNIKADIIQVGDDIND